MDNPEYTGTRSIAGEESVDERLAAAKERAAAINRAIRNGHTTYKAAEDELLTLQGEISYLRGRAAP